LLFHTSLTETEALSPDISGFIHFAFTLMAGCGAGASDGVGIIDGAGVDPGAGEGDGVSVGLDGSLGAGFDVGEGTGVAVLALEHATSAPIKTSHIDMLIAKNFTIVLFFITTSMFSV